MDPGVRFMDRGALLGVEDFGRLARLCVGLGVQKVRITGGEPTVHPDLTAIIAAVAGPGAVDVAMTTNGSRMDPASLIAWRRAGLDRITVSVDAVTPERFESVTRSRTSPSAVFRGIADARAAGFDPVKVNAVVVRGVNEDEVVPLARTARDLGVEMRFIEFMPLDSAHAWSLNRVVPADEIVSAIHRVVPLIPLGREDPSSTSLEFAYADGAPGGVGVIAPVTRPFCGACSRLRITADGKVRPCLFSRTEWDLRPLLRAGADDDQVVRFLVDATWTKQAGHGIRSPEFIQPARTMSAIGG
jgi:cyclic pyranopterin phosphate synthase